MKGVFNDLFGPSIFLMVLDLFLENPRDLMNVREVARRLGKNPGSISRHLPLLVDKNYITRTRVGEKIIAYQLDQNNKIVQLFLEFYEKFEEINSEE